MTGAYELILIFAAVICGVLSAAYFYETSDIFTDALRKPLRLISIGMMTIAVGVLIAATISYAETFGVILVFYNFPLQAYFYILYIIGSIFIAIGANKFTYRPKENI